MYLRWALKQCKRVPQCYAWVKLHQAKRGSRPVTGTGGLILAALSKWVDFKLQPLVEYCSDYIKDWEDLVTKLKHLRPLPCNARLFTIDATSMYTNIDTEHGNGILRKWLHKLQAKGKNGKDFPIQLS